MFPILKVVMLLAYSSTLLAVVDVPYIYETEPIPAGTNSTDDVAIFVADQPERSLILGVSKNAPKDGGKSGLFVYDLKGKELQYLPTERLNNVDLRQRNVLASNRDLKGNALFTVGDDLRVDYRGTLPLVDSVGSPISQEPYGLCMGQDSSGRTFVFNAFKDGSLFQHELLSGVSDYTLAFVRSWHARDLLSPSAQEDLIETRMRELLYEYETRPEMLGDLREKIEERYQLEGCVVDDETGTVFVGIESFGVLAINFNSNAKAREVFRVKRPSIDPEILQQVSMGAAVFTTDVEGIALARGKNGEKLLVVSIQGAHQYAVFNATTLEHKASFTLGHSSSDPVTETDGLEIVSVPLGNEFPMGAIIVHDDENRTGDGPLERANYKIASWSDVLEGVQ